MDYSLLKRILDIYDPTNPIEVAYYDTSDIEGLYVGNWGTYAYLPSGNIISSDIEQGLFVFELGGVSILHNDIQDINVRGVKHNIRKSTLCIKRSIFE